MWHRLHFANILLCISGIQSRQNIRDILYVNRESKIALEREFSSTKLQAATCLALRKLIVHSYETVPFYRNLWEEFQINVSHLTTLDDLLRLPLVSRSDLQLRPRQSIISKESRRTKLRFTSGTIGTSRVVLKDVQAQLLSSITARRLFVEYGIPSGSNILFVYSENRSPLSYETRISENWTRRIWVSIFDLIDSPQLATRLAADAIVGSPQQIEALAHFVYASNKVRPPKVFISIAELLDPRARQRIESLTGARVFDVYCSSEISTHIAFECRYRHGFHINSDYVHVEFLDSTGNPVQSGQRGEVVITDLFNFVSPLIRYRIGDIAKVTSGECSCGRALPLQIEHLDGRATDQILLRSGQSLNALPLVRELQSVIPYSLTLVQESFEVFNLNCYPQNKNQTNLPFDKAKQIVNRYLGSDVTLNVSIDEITNALSSTSGKIRAFTSRMPRNENIVLDYSH